MDTKADQSQPTAATAPGKVILFGEHAVVYGRPAIAVPVTDVRATAEISASEPGSGMHIIAVDLPAPNGSPGGRRYRLRDAPTDDPLRVTVELAVDNLPHNASILAHTEGTGSEPDLLITVSSTIPIARGLGSGAAVATAMARAIAHHFGHKPKPSEISRIVYEVERLHHGTPSGIDNTVIAYEQPVYFVRDEGLTRLAVGTTLHLIIADTGVVSSTRDVVGDVRRRWQAETRRFERLFDAIGAIARLARSGIEDGSVDTVGRLMDQNHKLLMALGVSSPDLDALAEAARMAGALGAKMSGAGWGGNIVALVEPQRAMAVADALREAGATTTIFSRVS